MSSNSRVEARFVVSLLVDEEEDCGRCRFFLALLRKSRWSTSVGEDGKAYLAIQTLSYNSLEEDIPHTGSLWPKLLRQQHLHFQQGFHRFLFLG